MQMQDFLEITHTHADTECLRSMQAVIHTIYWIAQEGAHCFARGGRAPSCPWLATGLDCSERWFTWGAGIKSRKCPGTQKQFVRFKRHEFPKRFSFTSWMGGLIIRSLFRLLSIIPGAVAVVSLRYRRRHHNPFINATCQNARTCLCTNYNKVGLSRLCKFKKLITSDVNVNQKTCQLIFDGFNHKKTRTVG